MNNHVTDDIHDWEYPGRLLQDEDTTQVPETNATLGPASAPTTSTVAPRPSAGSSSAFPVEAPSAGGVFSPTTDFDTIPPAPSASNWTLPPNPTSWETDTPGWAPTPSGSSTGGSKPSYNTPVENGYVAFLVIVVLAIVGVVCAWKFCKVWKARRERHMLRLQSTRVDAVLGDMQMVPPSGEYDDDDPELL
ncbi:hypothetical protein IV203_003055 [Nitzschia inconspicua]|uniref:Uncharacterized protein n=1 Tax=Nitzschia inconspicua TaxID=303405 RepID=A0A9K3L2Q2_9STRA|nr:hypothetical protein IV203_003055 [Nitzschia inconspicua]